MLHVKDQETIAFYNKNAKSFVENTRDVDFETTQKRFLEKLKHNANILDFGCGSGRDTHFFLEQGYSVTAMDGSEELCQLASEYTGISVKHMMFQEFSDENKYDGIWACSSILHLPYQELVEVLVQIAKALKENGVFYTSFKYGEFEGMRNGRYFTDMTEEKLGQLLQNVNELQVEEQWISFDVRPGRDEERWLNIILRKISMLK